MERLKYFFNTATAVALFFFLAGVLAVFYLNHTARRIMVAQAINSSKQTLHQFQHSTIPPHSGQTILAIKEGKDLFYLVNTDSISKILYSRYPWLQTAKTMAENGQLPVNSAETDKAQHWLFIRTNFPTKQDAQPTNFLLAYPLKKHLTAINQQLHQQLIIALGMIALLTLLIGISWYFLVTRKAKKLLSTLAKSSSFSSETDTFNELERLSHSLTVYQQQMQDQLETYNRATDSLRKINQHLENDLRAKEKAFDLLQNKLTQEINIRKIAENELNKLQHIIEDSPLSIVITNTAGQIEYVNPHFTEVTGYSFEESFGQNPRILKSGKLPAEAYKHLWETINKGQKWQGEFYNKKKNGELYWEYAYISAVKNTKGEITHYFAIKEDITAQKKLNESLKMYAQALTNIAETVIITDMAGRFLYTNKAFTQLYGYSAEEISEKPLSILFPESESAEIAQNVVEQSSRSSWFGELVNISKGGKRLDIQLSSSPIYNEQNQLFGIIGVIRDITDEKKKRESERKTEALKTVQELAGAVSHEFSQPLQALNNYLSLMEMTRDPQKYVQKSRDSLLRISALVNNLRDITSIQRQNYLDTQILNLKTSAKNIAAEKNNRILIVDDEEAIQETIVELLEMAGYQCDGASDGLAALNLLRRNEYGLILSDINMPKMSGSALFDKLQSIGYGGTFIFMTGYAHSKENEEFIQKGDGLLHKPIDALHLLDIVQKSIGAPV